MTPERCTFDDPATEAAAHVARLLRTSDPDRPVSLALSGGRTPAPLHRALAEMDDLPWHRTHVFLVDERFVPPDDAESNYRLARETLLDLAPIPQANVHPVPTTLESAEQAATAYEKMLYDVLGPAPAWDVALMGMGDDGHTASLFPGDDFMDDDRLIAATLAPPTSPVKQRITATLRLLNRTRHVVYLVTGEGKRDLVHRVFEDDAACPDVPAACVRGTESLKWYLDRAIGA